VGGKPAGRSAGISPAVAEAVSPSALTRKRALLLLLVVAVLALLVWLQFRNWREFDWTVFWQHTRRAHPGRIALAIIIVYSAYFLRALRWRVFLRPVRDASWLSLVPPQFIGFTGLALLGRPGELIRPYLIAKRENLPIPSQLAVWTVERIFDMAAFATLLALDLLFAPNLQTLPYFTQLQRGAVLVIASVAGLAIGAVLLRRNSERVAQSIGSLFTSFSSDLGRRAARRASTFGEGLQTIHDLKSFVQIVAYSLVIWILIAVAYHQITHAYPEPKLESLGFSHVVLLLGFTMVGSLVQLPAVGGGTQLAAIAALARVFDVPPEPAVSCGILLWLVSFMVVTPAGLVLAHREHLSLRKLVGAAREQN
jgi:uncharacterized protein (TIRG00374 family)